MAVEADIVKMFEETTKALGPITHLLNSAGISKQMRVDSYDAQALAGLFATNVTGLMLCCREAARRMSTKHGGKGGAIVNVSSMAATLGGRSGSSAYAATKGAVDSFTRGFAREVADEGIRVNSLRPGMVLTEMTETRLKDADFRKGIESSIPMRRVGEIPRNRRRRPVAPVGRSLLHHRRDARRGRRGLHHLISSSPPWGRGT